ncbi:MAG: hypothetical protein GX628_09375 [Clostridiales bacterium]|mgnify:CR=1 FL=1|nr:hypothetical protein [Clostridiales bacterium]
MELNERIVINYDNVCDTVRQVLDEIKELRADSFVRRILSAKDMEAIRSWENILQKRLEEPFSVVIMGDFKRGKSMLINAILGKNLTAVDVTPETVTINRIFYGEESNREAVLTNGMHIRLESDELGRSELERIIEHLPAPIDYIDIHEPAEILREISVVDTPGMNDVLKEFDSKVYSYISRADAVIYVASALSPLSETEQVFLSDILRPQSFSRLFLIVNMADCLDSIEDIERIKNLVYERVHAISVSAEVFALSALDEFCRKSGKERPNPELADYLGEVFEAFSTSLEHDILLQKDIIKSQRLVKISRDMVKETRGRINLIGKMLGIKKSELAGMEQKCHENMANIDSRLKKSIDMLTALSAGYCRDAKKWMNDFLDRIKSEVTTLGSSVPTTVLQKHLQFYLTDKIKQAVMACVGAHQPMLGKKLYECAEEFSGETLGGATEGHIRDISVQLADISWTDIDTASFAVDVGALLLFGSESEVYGIVSVISGVVGGFLRESTMKKKQVDLIKPLLDSFDSIRESVMTQLDRAYAALTKAACAKLEKVFKAQLNASIETLGQAQKILREEDIREEDLKDKLQIAGEILDRADSLLDGTGIDAVQPE